MLTLVPSSSVEVAVGASSTQCTKTLITTGPIGAYRYAFVANVACWLAQGANPTASAAAGSMFVPANTIVILDGHFGAKVAVIEDSTGGKASITGVVQ